MKRYIIYILATIGLSISLLYLVQIAIFDFILFKKMTGYFGIELYEAIDRINSDNKHVKKLILGDSSGKQLFNNGRYASGRVLSLTCNQAITMVGQYILLAEFYERNPDIKLDEVVLIYHPASFQNNLDLKFTYHYLLKPFYKNPTSQYFSPLVMEVISEIPYYKMCQFPIIKMTKWSPKYDYKENLEYSSFWLSEISIEYLSKLSLLCDEHQTQFNVKSPIIKEEFGPDYFYKEMKDQITNHCLDDEFQEYFENMQILPDSLFTDQIHLLRGHFSNIVQYQSDYLNEIF